jgi:RecA-family ATPase
MLASPPKIGKSCLVYQAAVQVALGGTLLGRDVDPGSALYLALEDGRRRGQTRLRVALEGRTLPVADYRCSGAPDLSGPGSPARAAGDRGRRTSRS